MTASRDIQILSEILTDYFNKGHNQEGVTGMFRVYPVIFRNLVFLMC